MTRLMEGEPEVVEQARRLMEAMGKPTKRTHPTPVQRSAARARKEIQGGEPKLTRERVQIMLWAIGKCGGVEEARDALDRAAKAIEEEPS